MVVFQTILVIVLTFSPLCGGQKTRFVREYSAPQDAVIGSSFTFNWTYVLVAPDTLDNIVLLYTTSFTPLLFVASDGTPDYSAVPAGYKGRITWTGDLKKSVVSFVLSNIALGDEASYNIDIKYSFFKHLQNSVILKVLVPAQFTAFPPSSQTVLEGKDLTLVCAADGKPDPNITWVQYLNRPTIIKEEQKQSKLTIAYITRPAGSVDYVFECQAVNIPGRAPITKQTRITVQYKAQIDKVASSSRMVSWIGQRVNLKCVAEGVPVPTLEWTKPDGSQLKPGKQSNIIAADLDFKTEADFGLYKCSAKNGLAPVDMLNIYVVQIKKPGPPIVIFSDEDIAASSLTIRWSPPDDNGGSSVTWYRVRVLGSEFNKLYTAKESIAIVSPLTTNTRFTLEVYARNVVGEGPSARKNFTTKDEAVHISTEKVTSAPTNIHGATSLSGGHSCEAVHVAYGIVIAILVFIILAQLLFICRRARETPKNGRMLCSQSGEVIQMSAIPLSNTSDIDLTNTTQFSAPPAQYMPLVPSTRNWELNRSNVSVTKIIGKGAFSEVGKATATGIPGIRGEVTVAVKMLKENASATDKKDLLAELELMKTFKPHPHVIRLLGCVTESEPPLVIIEYVPYGDLLGYLKKSRGLSDTYYKDPDVKPITNLASQQLMKFAWQIADGMSYLASKKVIHRDLAARNVLVGEGEKCKVTDFGMARDVHQDDIYTKRSKGRLPVKWTAYESLLYGVYTTQSDVWSFGVVLYEIFTIGGRPYPNMDGRRIAARLQEGYRMPKPAHLEDRLYSIMTDCWKENPNERPTFSELKDVIAKMERNHRTYINLREYDGSLYANADDLGVV